MLRNTVSQYGSVAKFFHWSVSIMVITLLTVGLLMGNITDKNLKGQVYMLHKSFGLTVLALMLLRLLWTLSNIKPKLPAGTPTWQIVAERIVHYGFYVLLIVMPFSGWVMSTAANRIPQLFGLVALPLPGVPVDKALAGQASSLHSYVGYTIITFLIIHVSAAGKHYFINRDSIMQRMLPSRRRSH